MKEHPIIFSTAMVQAILEGRKMQTRRIVKLQPDNESYYLMKVKEGVLTVDYNQGDNNPTVKCPYGKPGDLMWVRESFAKATDPEGEIYYYYKADRKHSEGKWKPSIHMPKAAARIWLSVKNIFVERVQDISEEDAIDEGVGVGFQINAGWPDYEHINNDGICTLTQDNARMSFSSLWCKINGRESWDENPWVWVVEFEMVDKEHIKGPENRTDKNEQH